MIVFIFTLFIKEYIVVSKKIAHMYETGKQDPDCCI